MNNPDARYVNVGLDLVLWERDLIGIFDLDSTTVKKDTRAFLSRAQANGQVADHCTDLPVTFLLSRPPDGDARVLLTSFSLPTLVSRVERRFP